MNASVAPAPPSRTELGDVLRDLHRHQGYTLREISSGIQVPLGYLSEVGHGQEEAPFELLGVICLAFGVSFWFVLREVSGRIVVSSSTAVPDTVPEDLVSVILTS